MGLEDLPEEPGEEREQIIRQMVCREAFYDDIEWSTISLNVEGTSMEFYVMSDALKIEGVRINVSAETQQHIADSLGCCLLTAKVLDIIWDRRAVTLEPSPQDIAATTQAMREYSGRIDMQLEAQGSPGGLKSTLGKHWVLTPECWTKNRVPQQACNYGWHFGPRDSIHGITGEKSVTGNTHVLQGRSFHHDIRHVDYNQICRLMARQCYINEELADLADVLQDPGLSRLISHNGPLPSHRHPFVDQKYQGKVSVGMGVPVENR